MKMSVRRDPADPPPEPVGGWPPRPVPWGGVVARVRAATTGRRAVPTGLALIGTDLICELALRLSPARMAAAVERTETIVAGTPAEDDLSRVARRYVAARARGWELSWRPWEINRVPIRGEHRLTAARGAGRGVIVSHCHLGPLAAWVSLGRALPGMLTPAGDWLLDEPRPGYNGYQTEHWRRLHEDAGVVLLYNTGSAPRVYKTLRAGGAVLLALDVPGTRRTRFLGKPVDLDDGTAHLAVKTGALVLPVALVPVGRRWEIQVGEAFDPLDFADPDDLHVALAEVHEELIMRAPEHLESPPLWLWGRASRDGWFRE